MHTGTANLPLHWGKAPKWLFSRMKKLAREITFAIVEEYGPQEMLTRLADPYWFQAFGCILGYDWHSSGLTTTTCAALKCGIRNHEKELGLFICGGKGGTSRKTPDEIKNWGETTTIRQSVDTLIYASRMSAKIDSSAIQDGYQLYHHNFVFTKEGTWSVIQQGMNKTNRYARRYHWHSEKVEDFTNSPNNKICDRKKYKNVLNLVSPESSDAKGVIVDIAGFKPDKIVKNYKQIIQLNMPRREWITKSDIQPKNLGRTLLKTYESQPKDFESLLNLKGVGPKTIRALSLISELTYGTKADWNDPVKYTFAHGGKDGYPYPVDKPTYDTSIKVLKEAIRKAKLDKKEKKEAFHKLSKHF